MRSSATPTLRVRGRALRFLIVPVLLGLPNVVHADGKSFGGRDLASWYPLMENEQLAAIQHADGVERMVLAINISMKDPDDRALWIVPIPGRPENVRVDLHEAFPRFNGRDLIRSATDTVLNAGIALRATQIYPLVFEMCLLLPSLSSSRGFDLYAEIEKFGLRSELLTADSVDALAEHLKTAGVNLDRNEIADLEPYLNDRHVLVATWIASREELSGRFPELNQRSPTRDRWPCVYIEFPSQEPFFPLKPTRSYGGVEMTVRLFVLGFVTPRTSAAFRDDLRVYYCRHLGKRVGTKSDPDSTGFDPSKGAPYTSIWLETTADQFTDDLRFDPTTPCDVYYADAVNRLRDTGLILVVFAVLLGLISYVSAGLAGLILWKRWAEPARLGLWNMLTLVALNAAARRRSLIAEFGPVEDWEERRLRRRYVAYFSAIFVLMSFGVQIVLMLPWSIK